MNTKMYGKIAQTQIHTFTKTLGQIYVIVLAAYLFNQNDEVNVCIALASQSNFDFVLFVSKQKSNT